MKKFIAIAVLLTIGFNANAQTSSSASQTTTLDLSDVLNIVFTGTKSDKGAEVVLEFKTINNYADGVESDKQELLVSTNKHFNVDVKANASNFTYTGSTSPAPTMPVKDVLGLKVVANKTGGSVASPFSTSGYSPITSSNQNLISVGSQGNEQVFTIQYKAEPGFKYPSGKYSVDVVYTATHK